MSEGAKRTVIRRKNGEGIVIRDLRSEAETRIVHHGTGATLEVFHTVGTVVLRAELLDIPHDADSNSVVAP